MKKRKERNRKNEEYFLSVFQVPKGKESQIHNLRYDIDGACIPKKIRNVKGEVFSKGIAKR